MKKHFDSPVVTGFNSALKKYAFDSLMKSSGTVIAAYSGGADSSCLLHLLHAYCTENGITLAAAHVNHMIRGEDADSDENFCRDECARLGIPLYVKKADVPALSRKSGMGIEEAARVVRYEFFRELSQKHGAVIATAHNADDNCETLLFNILRGSGLRGLGGISPVRDGVYIRPLIEVSGEEIRAFCSSNGIKYVYDKTNSDTDYTRNKIRREVMPILREIVPNPEKSVTKLTEMARRDESFISGYAREQLRGRDRLTRDEFNTIHDAILSRMLIMLYENLTGVSAIEEKHISKVIRLAREKQGESTLSIPGGTTAKITRDCVYFVKNRDESGYNKTTGEVVFRYPDDGDVFDNGLYRVEFSQNKHNFHQFNDNIDENIYKLSILRTFCFDKIKDVLEVRYRREGDAYVFGGMRRKIKKLFIDRKLSAEEKSLTPIICDREGILLVPPYPLRDGVSVNDCVGSTDGEQNLTIIIRKK